jgi:hypothetical protein
MPSPERDASVVRLYVRDGCHLCEEAIEMIEELRKRVPPFAVELIDIESDERLHAAYLERIPVAEVKGTEVFELVPDERALLAVLAPGDTF